MIEYKTIKSLNIYELEMEVNQCLEAGYELRGNILSAPSGIKRFRDFAPIDQTQFIQVVTKNILIPTNEKNNN